jgi:hypothetical protein
MDEAGNPCGFGQHWVLKPGSGLCAGTGLIGRSSSRSLPLRWENLASVRLYSGFGLVEIASESTEEVMFIKLMCIPRNPVSSITQLGIKGFLK